MNFMWHEGSTVFVAGMLAHKLSPLKYAYKNIYAENVIPVLA